MVGLGRVDCRRVRADSSAVRPIRTCASGRLRGFAAVVFFLGVTMAQAESLSIEGIPWPLSWHNVPTGSHIDGGKLLAISAGPKTDWFVDPFDGRVANTAPTLLFTPVNAYVFHSKVQVRFISKWDAGALMVWADDHHWAKLAFELSPGGQPTIVSVVTRGLSDDCNSVSIAGDSVYLRIARTGTTYVFYYSTDAANWHVVRTFSLEATVPVSLGFESQSPAGTGSTAVFSQISYSQREISNVYKVK
jgi:uncharacterized protein